MTMVETTYNAYFPAAYQKLLEVYQNAIQSEGEDSVVWCERFKGLVAGWRALNDEGMLPVIFCKNFCHDISHIKMLVHQDLDMSKLTDQQKHLPFAIENLQRAFGGC